MAFSRVFNNDIANFLENTPFTPIPEPFTMACWAKFTVPNTVQTIMCITDRTGNNDFHALNRDDTNTIAAVSRESSNSQSLTLNTFTDSGYHHCAGVWASATSREAFLDGIGGNIDVAARSPASLDTLAIGNLRRLSNLNLMDGSVAWPCIWNVALDDLEIAALAAGAYPTSVRFSDIIHFWPFLNPGGGTTPEIDQVGTADLAVNGTVGAAADADVLVEDWRSDLVDGLVDISGAGNDSEFQKVRDALKADLSVIVRLPNNVVTITLPAAPAYNIGTDGELQVTVPASALLESTSPVIGTPTATIIEVAQAGIPAGVLHDQKIEQRDA